MNSHCIETWNSYTPLSTNKLEIISTENVNHLYNKSKLQHFHFSCVKAMFFQIKFKRWSEQELSFNSTYTVVGIAVM